MSIMHKRWHLNSNEWIFNFPLVHLNHKSVNVVASETSNRAWFFSLRLVKLGSLVNRVSSFQAVKLGSKKLIITTAKHLAHTIRMSSVGLTEKNSIVILYWLLFCPQNRAQSWKRKKGTRKADTRKSEQSSEKYVVWMWFSSLFRLKTSLVPFAPFHFYISFVSARMSLRCHFQIF